MHPVENELASRVTGFWRCRRLLAGALVTLLASGCQSTFSETVGDTVERALTTSLPANGRDHRIAAITYSEGGSAATSQALREVTWEFVDRAVTHTPRCTSVSPELVRRTLIEANLEPADLHTRGDRERFLAILDEEQQRPEILLLAKLNQQNTKTGPGYRTSRILLSVEVVDCSTGNRLAKENSWLSLELYR
ncbi:MAG: hypothetical protein AB7O52_01115 [Planctomycetota bacterium]